MYLISVIYEFNSTFIIKHLISALIDFIQDYDNKVDKQTKMHKDNQLIVDWSLSVWIELLTWLAHHSLFARFLVCQLKEYGNRLTFLNGNSEKRLSIYIAETTIDQARNCSLNARTLTVDSIKKFKNLAIQSIKCRQIAIVDFLLKLTILKKLNIVRAFF